MSHTASSTDAPDEEHGEQGIEHDDPKCPMCGSLIAPLLPKVSSANEAEEEDDENPPKQADLKKAKGSATSKKARKKGGPRVKSTILKMKAARLLVRRNMLTCIPGIGPAKASAVVDFFKSGTLTQVMHAEKHELCGLGEGRAKLTQDDAAAILRALQ